MGRALGRVALTHIDHPFPGDRFFDERVPPKCFGDLRERARELENARPNLAPESGLSVPMEWSISSNRNIPMSQMSPGTGTRRSAAAVLEHFVAQAKPSRNDGHVLRGVAFVAMSSRASLRTRSAVARSSAAFSSGESFVN
jgi:hypothetical protein